MPSMKPILRSALPLDPPVWHKSLIGPQRDIFNAQLALMHDSVVDIYQDDLPQLLPVVLATGQTIPTLRRAVGKAVWRMIHHASEQTNFLRSLIWLRFQPEVTWADIVAVPDVHLRSCRNTIDWDTARLASRLAEPGRFLQITMLYRDVVNMGGRCDQDCSLGKLKRIHAELSIQTAIADADLTNWCAPFQTEVDGYSFSRLTSDRDFVVEGKTQRHCVATMCEEAKAGTVIVLRCSGSERATVRIDADGSLEVVGFANSDVSDQCIDAAKVVSVRLKADRNGPRFGRM